MTQARTCTFPGIDYTPTQAYAATPYAYAPEGQGGDAGAKSSIGGADVQDYGFRLYSPGIARFLSVDPLTASYPELTPYQFASNSPISGIDSDGLECANATTGEGLGPLNQEKLESSEFTIVDSRTVQEGTTLVKAYLPSSAVTATRLPKSEADGQANQPIVALDHTIREN